MTPLSTSIASALTGAHASTASADPPAPPSMWLVACVALAATLAWWMHWRWRTGRYFMSRFTTAEGEKAKLAVYGPPMLPAAICLTAMTAMLGTWSASGPSTHAWFVGLTLLLAIVVTIAGIWTVKEWCWPSKRRVPSWQRENASD